MTILMQELLLRLRCFKNTQLLISFFFWALVLFLNVTLIFLIEEEEKKVKRRRRRSRRRKIRMRSSPVSESLVVHRSICLYRKEASGQ